MVAFAVVAVMTGIDPHKASHTAVAISSAEELLGQLRVRASAAQVGRLLGWAQGWVPARWLRCGQSPYTYLL